MIFFLITGAILLLTGCGKSGQYRPLSADIPDMPAIQSALDSAFHEVATSGADAFPSEAQRFMETYYSTEEPDQPWDGFNPRTSYALMQDSILYYMQDYLLNECRYRESAALGLVLRDRLTDSAPQQLRSASLNDVAVANFYLGNLDEAIKYQKECYDLDVRADDAELISSDLNQLAAMCLRADKYDLARDYIIEAVKVEKPLARDEVLAIRYGLASEIYLKLDSLDVARDYAAKALALDRREGREVKIGIRLSQLAAIQIAKGDYADAETSLIEALPLLRNSQNTNS